MTEIGRFIMEKYYSKYKGPRFDVVPTVEQLEKGIKQHPDKLVVVRDDKIKGVGIFLTLSDETFKMLQSFDITQVDVLMALLQEHGPNIHFVLLCADGQKTILTGINMVKAKYKPKTISWWNPDLSKLHKYEIRGLHTIVSIGG